jgi:hypothetical protein
MKPYHSISKTTGQSSGVIGYEEGPDYIIVYFVGGARYRYSYHSCGMQHVGAMKNLAHRQKGLSTYISREKPEWEGL